MKLLIIGGKLQGIEAAYLARRAGWNVHLIDRRADAPARYMADLFYSFDVLEEPHLLETAMKSADVIIPAIEDDAVLAAVFETAERVERRIIFHPAAYEVSSSKLKSNELLATLPVVIPAKGNKGVYPLIAKPSGESGSRGVRKIRNKEEWEQFTQEVPDYLEWVVEEYVEGPSYSIEVIGHSGQYRTFQITELYMDEIYDCCRVVAPAELPPYLRDRLSEYAVTIASRLELEGIMDVVVILARGQLYVLEIDARIPSQTPITVLNSSGVNLLEHYVSMDSVISPGHHTRMEPLRHVLYEHILVTPEGVKICGEHIMGNRGPLYHQQGFFGADEAITDYNAASPDRAWAATLIITAENRESLMAKEKQITENIKNR